MAGAQPLKKSGVKRQAQPNWVVAEGKVRGLVRGGLKWRLQEGGLECMYSQRRVALD